jgi:3'-phosphoadenosine 5'-phosphosulfate sulfotransferase (PAPS reductase)/FAD synthetase
MAKFNSKKLSISLSGGRTSSVMTYLLWTAHRTEYDEVLVTFANTGCEHPATLDFVHKFERHFNIPVVWIEADVDPRHGKGVGYSVVDYRTASRNGEPFEAAVAKYGIFNKTTPQCTGKLKTVPMQKFLADQGFFRGKKINYSTAIGIRADELDRVSVRADEERFYYPLIEWGLTKRDVALAIQQWPFDLQIPHDAYGNCTWCWKKSLRKHMTLAQEDPSVFDFPRRMEEKYGTLKGDSAAGNNGRRYWFRGHKTVGDIIAASRETEFKPYVDDPYEHGLTFDPDLDIASSCEESCEVYPTDGT